MDNICSKLEDTARMYSCELAIVNKNDKLTYADMIAEANNFASNIMSYIGQCEQPIVLMYSHGSQSIIAQIATLKCGNIFCNLDGSLPLNQLSLILAELGARYIVYDSSHIDTVKKIHENHKNIISYNSDEFNIDNCKCIDEYKIKLNETACIVYTSGTTGAPKGVIITHSNIIHISQIHNNDIGISNLHKTAHICPLWTIASISEVYTSLLNGLTLFPFSLLENDIYKLADLIEKERITSMVFNPSIFRIFINIIKSKDKVRSLRCVRLGGEEVRKDDLLMFYKYFNKSCEIRISYGSTEFLTVSRISYHYSTVNNFVRNCVGKPYEGSSIKIINDNYQETRAIGQIVVKSKKLSPGYWNNSNLTKLRYKEIIGNERFYLTNDIGYLTNKGDLVLLGRKDNLIKINGKFVDISYIEKIVLKYGLFDQVVVYPFENKQCIKQIALIFTLKRPLNIDYINLRCFLSKYLVFDQMPSKYIKLDSMPRTSNMKINRKKLLEYITN